jgi:hypothetical protein
MNRSRIILLLPALLLINSCITQFIPKTTENKELLVVEGLITDKPGASSVKLSKSFPLGIRNDANPVTMCAVTVIDDLGNIVSFWETVKGTYVPPSDFCGVPGRSYTLLINTNSVFENNNFVSVPMKMIPVPPIDSVYYEKLNLNEYNGIITQQGCQIYLNTHDESNICKYYRWEYTETWKIILPYTVTNKICYVSNNSSFINIKSTSVLAEDRINRYPLNNISNATDRLGVKYSILVNQYSLNEDEYLYWEKLQSFSEQVGGLYDMIPSVVPSNIFCSDDPNVKVMGYFSVSAISSKRIFIKDRFAGVFNPYTNDACIADTVFGGTPVPASAWVIISNFMPTYNVYTYSKGCADCTTRGNKVPPDFWIEDK